MILVNYILYARASYMARNYTERLAIEICNKAKQRLDDHISNLLFITDQISSSSTICAIARLDMTHSEFLNNAYQSQVYLRDIRSNNPAIDNIYIYIQKQDIILSPDFVYSCHSYYDTHIYKLKCTQDEWKSLLVAEQYPRVIKIPKIYMSAYQDEILLKTTIEFYDGNYFNVMISFSNDSFFKTLQEYGETETHMIAFDVVGNVISWIDDESLQYSDDFWQQISFDSTGRAVRKSNVFLEGEKFTLIFYESEKAGVKVAYAMPTISLLGEVLSLRNMFFIIFALSAFITTVSFIIFGYINYKPVIQLLDKFHYGKKRIKKMNEYAALDFYINDVLEEKAYYKELAHHTEDMLKRLFIEKLMQFKLDPNYIESMAKRFGMIKDPVLLQVAISPITSCHGSMNDENREHISTIKEIGDFFYDRSQSMQTYLSSIDGFIVILFLFSQKPEDFFMNDLLNDLKNRLSMTQNKHTSFYVSNMVNSYQKLPQAYQQAISVFEYAVRTQWSGNLFYSDVSSDSNIKYSYTLSDEQKLLAFIRTGNAQASKAFIRNILKKNTDGFLNEFEIRCLTYEICSTLIKAIKEMSGKQSNADKIKLIEQLSSVKNIFNIRDELFIIIEDICRDFSYLSEFKESKLLEQIKEIVKENYRDSNFNVSSIAEKLDMNLSYISKYFKDKTDKKLLDYITEMRIELAKNMLIDTNETVKSIANQSGFSNIRTFNRVFLNTVGVSPDKYRKSHRN